MPAADPPFLSVVVRAHGERPWLVHDALLALAAQTSDDLDVLLVADADRDDVGALEEVVGAFAEDLRARVHLVGGRVQPGNRLADIATAETRGRYLAVLDEGEVPMGNWAAELRRAGAAEPGQAVHGAVAEQRVAPQDWQGRPAHAPVGPVSAPEDARFDFVDHLEHLATFAGSGGVAVPRELVARLSPPEDGPDWDAWAVLLRAVLGDGVASTGTMIALRRYCSGIGGEPDAARRTAMLARLDAGRVMVPPGSLQRVQRLAGERSELRDRVGALEREQAEAAAAATRREHQLRRERDEAAAVAADAARAVEEFRRSTSWRLTEPVRAAGGLVRRLGRRAAH